MRGRCWAVWQAPAYADLIYSIYPEGAREISTEPRSAAFLFVTGQEPTSSRAVTATLRNGPLNAWSRVVGLKAPTFLAALALSVLCSGCASVGVHLLGSQGVYPGVRFDFDILVRGGGPGFALDLPFSAAGDTLLLPLDLVTPTDPLRKGWNIEPDGGSHLSREIVDDYEEFIRKQKLEKPASIRFYADRGGRHAVTIALERDGRYINYTLIYDKLNVRTKSVKWTETIIRMG